MLLVFVCLKILLFFSQEVVEKNLRLTQDAMKKRDDVESMDNDSTMSTSSNLEPFANDDLGISFVRFARAFDLNFFLYISFYRIPGICLNCFAYCL